MGYALQEGDREPAPDSAVIPGPTLVLERGRPVRITVVNRLAEPTAVHWHGIELESYPTACRAGADGRTVAPPIAPGDSFTARVHSAPRGDVHLPLARERDDQIQGGLYGALIVVEPGTTLDTATNRLVIVGGLFRHDSAFGVVNGRLAPAPIEIRAGRTLPLPAHQHRRRADVVRPPRAGRPILAGGVARGGEGRRRPAAVSGGGRAGPLAHRPRGDGGFRGRVEEPGELRLEVDSPFAGWRVEVPVRVR